MNNDILQQWARVWAISDRALADLSDRLTVSARAEITGEAYAPRSEGYVQSRLLLDSGYRPDVLLFRNNVGVLRDERGRPVRFGLANDSKNVNGVVKSADLIGVWRRVIQSQDVGRTIGQFVSIEVKREGWRLSPADKHEGAQAAWSALIDSYGGVACFFSGGGNFFDTLEQRK